MCSAAMRLSLCFSGMEKDMEVSNTVSTCAAAEEEGLQPLSTQLPPGILGLGRLCFLKLCMCGRNQ
jgi:hypothetical protein